jgi:hypothetical protein
VAPRRIFLEVFPAIREKRQILPELGSLMEVLLAVFTLIVLTVYCILFVGFVLLLVLDPAKPEAPEAAKVVEPSPNVNRSWP